MHTNPGQVKGQTKDNKIGICCFSAKQHQGVKAKTGSLALNQGSVSKWSDMSTHRLLIQWASTIQIKLIIY
jgi:hypothetical protein